MLRSVFTYGTLQIPAVMETVTGRKFSSSPAVLEDFACYTVKQQVYPGIVPARGKHTAGTVYIDLDKAAIDALDAFEDVLYIRTHAIVNCNDKKVSADIYAVREKYRHLLSNKPWDINVFRQNHLASYLVSCRKFYESYRRLRQS